MFARIKAIAVGPWPIAGLYVAFTGVVVVFACTRVQRPQIVPVPSKATAGAIVIDGREYIIPPGHTFVYDSTVTKTGPASTRTTDRAVSYIDWSSAASIGSALIENVDWKALLTGPFGWVSGGVGLLGLIGGKKALDLHAHKHQSIGRAQIRNAKGAA